MSTCKSFTVEPDTPVSTMFVDESGSKNSGGGFFVVGMVKVRDTGLFLRGVRNLRDKHRMYGEIKFSSITSNSTHFYFDLAEYMAVSPIRIAASVYDSKAGFPSGEPTWLVQARMTAKLVVANVNQEGEAVNVLLDLVQTPPNKSAASVVRDMARSRLRSTCVIEAYDLDSQSTDGLQVADFVASAISYARRFESHDPSRPKAQVSARLRRSFGLDSFADVREGKVNILTLPQTGEK